MEQYQKVVRGTGPYQRLMLRLSIYRTVLLTLILGVVLLDGFL